MATKGVNDLITAVEGLGHKVEVNDSQQVIATCSCGIEWRISAGNHPSGPHRLGYNGGYCPHRPDIQAAVDQATGGVANVETFDTTGMTPAEQAAWNAQCQPSKPCGRCAYCTDRSNADAKADRGTFQDRLRAALVDTDGLDGIPEPEPLIKDTLFLDSLAWLQGQSGHGKSFVALDIAGCVATGEVWQNRGAAHQGRVLYLAAEGVSGVRQRVRAWEQAMGRKMTGVTFLPMAVQASSPMEWPAFIEVAGDLRPVLIVIDTQARVTVGMNENGSDDMGVFVDQAEKLRRATGACVLIVHHQGHNGDHMRGSTALIGAATTIISVAKDGDTLTVGCVKQKDSPEFDKFRLRLVSFGPSAIVSLTDNVDSDLQKNPAVVQFLTAWWNNHETDWVSATTLIDTDLIKKPTFYRYIKPLEKGRFVASEPVGKGYRYRLTGNPSDRFSLNSLNSVSPSQ